MVKLSPEALAQLQTLRAALVERGEIFGLPAHLVTFRGQSKPRYCLVAAVEGSGGGSRVHLVPGTTKRASGPAVVVEVGETDLIHRTEFDFSASFPLPVGVVVANGRPKGSLPAGRLAEIDTAIRASNLVALKRLIGP